MHSEYRQYVSVKSIHPLQLEQRQQADSERSCSGSRKLIKIRRSSVDSVKSYQNKQQNIINKRKQLPKKLNRQKQSSLHQQVMQKKQKSTLTKTNPIFSEYHKHQQKNAAFKDQRQVKPKNITHALIYSQNSQICQITSQGQSITKQKQFINVPGPKQYLSKSSSFLCNSSKCDKQIETVLREVEFFREELMRIELKNQALERQVLEEYQSKQFFIEELKKILSAVFPRGLEQQKQEQKLDENGQGQNNPLKLIMNEVVRVVETLDQLKKAQQKNSQVINLQSQTIEQKLMLINQQQAKLVQLLNRLKVFQQQNFQLRDLSERQLKEINRKKQITSVLKSQNAFFKSENAHLNQKFQKASEQNLVLEKNLKLSNELIQRLQRELQQLKLQKLNDEKETMNLERGKYHTRQTGSQQIGQNNSYSFQTKLKNHAETQTDEKRIGAAYSLQKILSLDRINMDLSSKSGSYRHYQLKQSEIRRRSSILQRSSSSKGKFQLDGKSQPMVNNNLTPKKKNLQVIKARRLNVQKTTKQKKKGPIRDGYLNNLIPSTETLPLKEEQTKEITQSIQLSELQNTFNTEDSNQISRQNVHERSRISTRRQVYRSRSQSQREFSANGRIQEGRGVICARVQCIYSLNPLNKYGQKRLCNEVNQKRLRRITKLSEESQEIEQRIKQLKQQEKQLLQKVKQVQLLRISREKPKKEKAFL